MPDLVCHHITVPVGQTQQALSLLEPYLPHDSAVGVLSSPTPATRRLLLHPRIGAVPEALRERGVALGGEWGSASISLTEAERVRLFTVVFFSRSSLSPPPAPGLPRTWRRVLSNFHLTTLDIQGAPYASVEHFFQSAKAACSDRPEMARWFRADASGPEAVGADPGAAKKAGGRGAYRRHGATLDAAAWERKRVGAMQAALDARWTQDALFREVLCATRGLSLLHFERAGARSFWGGSLRKSDGLPQGHNKLGKMLTALRDERL